MASQGYLIQFHLYVGKTEEIRKQKLGTEVVLNFVKLLPEAQHTIIGDSFFGSLELVEQLKHMGKRCIFTTSSPKWLFAEGIHKISAFSSTKLAENEWNWSRRDDDIFLLYPGMTVQLLISLVMAITLI
jgi:hypothetical protein